MMNEFLSIKAMSVNDPNERHVVEKTARSFALNDCVNDANEWEQAFEIRSFKPERLADERSTPVEERSFGALA